MKTKRFPRTRWLLLLVLVLPAVMQAQDYTYTTDNGKITITKYTGIGGDVTIPSEIGGLPVTSIGQSAFDSSSPTSITIPDSVISIEDSAFHFCRWLTNVVIGNSVTSIGNYAFSSCGNLTGVTMPKGIADIGSNAFSWCTSLTSISIPDSVTSIRGSAFSDCTSLTNFVIPSSVTNIGSDAFSWCSSLTAITADARNSSYCTVDGILFDKNKTRLILYPGGKTADYVIPESVTSIGDFALAGCSGLTNLTMPNGITTIGDHAFDTCSSLRACFKNDDCPL